MSEHEHEEQAEAQDAGGTTYDAPNQEVVGVGPPWVEGTGGTEGARAEETGNADTSPDLDSMTKDELLDHARSLGVSPANAAMTKDELRESIDTHNKEGDTAQ